MFLGDVEDEPSMPILLVLGFPITAVAGYTAQRPMGSIHRCGIDEIFFGRIWVNGA
jgi:hypothetical protein